MIKVIHIDKSGFEYVKGRYQLEQNDTYTKDKAVILNWILVMDTMKEKAS